MQCKYEYGGGAVTQGDEDDAFLALHHLLTVTGWFSIPTAVKTSFASVLSSALSLKEAPFKL